MPVGRIEYFHLSPMSFQEFLIAHEDSYLAELLDNFDFSEEIPITAHKQLLDRQRKYLFIGGMPEAIYNYTQSHNLFDANHAHESILSTLKDDFNKYTTSTKELLMLQNLLKLIPANIGQKIKYSKIATDIKSRDIKHAIQLLSLARICSQVFHSSCSGLPLEASERLDVFKLLFVDVGLMNCILGLDWTAIRSRNHQTLINEGGLAEQFIGQHLLYRFAGHREPHLNYWLREGRVGNAEVDYVISSGDWIVPIEVKAGQSGSLRSLHQFIYAKQSTFCLRFDLNLPSTSSFKTTIKVANGTADIEYQMMSLPLYFIEQTNRLLLKHRNI